MRLSVFIARRIQVDGCKHANAQTFIKLGETKDLPQRDSLIKETIQVSDSAPVNLIKFVILDGWDDFTSVHSIEI